MYKYTIVREVLHEYEEHENADSDYEDADYCRKTTEHIMNSNIIENCIKRIKKGRKNYKPRENLDYTVIYKIQIKDNDKIQQEIKVSEDVYRQDGFENCDGGFSAYENCAANLVSEWSDYSLREQV
jgi:hypothetical protein